MGKLMLLLSLSALFASISFFDKSVRLSKITPYHAQEFITNGTMSLMTYNIRFNFLDHNKQSWLYRKEKLIHNIRLKQPDILTVQEDTLPQLEDLKSYLKHDGYDLIGLIPNMGMKSHHNTIFFKKNKYSATFNETIWLNENGETDKLGWDGWFPRSGTIAKFRTLSNGTKFIIVNVHLDHRGRKARVEGMKKIIKTVDRLLEEEDVPVFIMGDFNESPRQFVYNQLSQNGFNDIWIKCFRNKKKCAFGEQYSTSFHLYWGAIVNNLLVRNALYIVYYFHGGKCAQYNRYHIDHVFYRSSNGRLIEPKYFSMPSDDLKIDRSGIYASDHFPLFTVVKFN